MATQALPQDRPAPVSFEEILHEVYHGEVGGEAFFSALLARFPEPDQQYKLGSLLQLETEFKARVRPLAVCYGVDIVERDESRKEVLQFADALEGETWHEVMSSFAELMPGFVERFEALGSSVPPEHAEFGQAIIEHETSIGEFAALEAAGETDRSIDRVEKQLIYPLPKPK
jgi:hypothetical protein